MRLTIFSNRRGLLSATFTPLLLLGLALVGVLADGLGPIAVALLVLGGGLLLVTAFDYPRRCVFEEDGIWRISFLRGHLLPWERVNSIERARTLMDRRRRRRRRRRDTPTLPRSAAGLVARVGKRRYLLVNTLESLREFESLTELVETSAPHVLVSADPPAVTRAPTDLYRRNRKAG